MNTYLQTTTSSPLFYIRLFRPEKRNALSGMLVSELKKVLTDVSLMPDIRAVIITAEGSVFSAGADLDYLKQLMSNTYEENLADSQSLAELFLLLYHYPKIVITQIEGAAIAGGCGLACMGDFVFAVPEATFGYTEVKIGFIPAIVSIFLIRKIGEAKAREILLSGSVFSSQEAKDYGMITKIVPRESIAEHVTEFALRLCRETSPESIRLTKELIAGIQDKELEGAIDYAAEMNAKARGTNECREGITAFLEKRKVQWLR